MMKPDINVFLMNLPGKKNEVIIENEDGSYTIVIDDQLSQEGKLQAYSHAYRHIESNHFEKDNVQEIESETHRSVGHIDLSIMKKYIALFLLLPLVLLSGCGHKSDGKLIDIEQFKCQDSIQTVFDVLGKTELKTSGLESDRYEYDGLNLFGYDGTAVFHVRDNNDTISSFYCSFTLNKNEFEDVLTQLSDKYGEYKKSEYTNQIAYVWEIPEDEAEQLGYNEISFSDYGNKKAIVDFRDQWSGYNDEAYYEYLEEKDKLVVLAEKTCEIGADSFHFTLGQRGDEYEFTLLCIIENKTDAYNTHLSLNSIMNSSEDVLKPIQDIFSYCIVIGDGTLLMRTSDMLLITSGDGKVISMDDYFSIDWILSEANMDSDYGTQVLNFLIDFIENE